MFHLNIHENFITFKILSSFDFLSSQEYFDVHDDCQEIRADQKLNELPIAKSFQKVRRLKSFQILYSQTIIFNEKCGCVLVCVPWCEVKAIGPKKAFKSPEKHEDLSKGEPMSWIQTPTTQMQACLHHSWEPGTGELHEVTVLASMLSCFPGFCTPEFYLNHSMCLYPACVWCSHLWMTHFLALFLSICVPAGPHDHKLLGVPPLVPV